MFFMSITCKFVNLCHRFIGAGVVFDKTERYGVGACLGLDNLTHSMKT